MALGKSVPVGGTDVSSQTCTIMHLSMGTLKDLSSKFKQEAALKTLGQLCLNAGHIAKPSATSRRYYQSSNRF
ncbi:hypothetical protein MJO28_006275 [Puccinia striiformis f. sp. tritici]|uniref:Uncharacterized protein n=1 Tax=Puccinia striiformis f. sp. tritici TaxID=168172 RepID=A0ACC0EIT7_9BASI|nr:hypothetical protein MJO28_006275 [Puccinia striiformis f. sp. tritici]